MAKDKRAERKARAKKIVAYLKRAYPIPKTELSYETPMQLLAAVMLSAQSTDKLVNRVTATLFARYRTVDDFANAKLESFSRAISSVSFFPTKARAITGAAQIILRDFGGKIPKTVPELTRLPGVGYKTATVVQGELYGLWEGIPTDTHVRRFALRFDLTDHKELTKISKDLESLVPRSDWKFVNNGLVLYGRYVCSAIPHDCTNHPLTRLWPKAASCWPRAK